MQGLTCAVPGAERLGHHSSRKSTFQGLIFKARAVSGCTLGHLFDCPWLGWAHLQSLSFDCVHFGLECMALKR